ncbi:MAG: DNA alkylation repair protein [Candidatus Taylorbacteria bacterium]|nr:DNA alkylation repair protein [Candidatus Taylorbacteria bacterium]
MAKLSSGNIKAELEKLKDHKKAEILRRFFKTGKGEYGEGDEFLGIIVPKQRIVAKKFVEAPLSEVKILLNSKIHEHRFTAIAILVQKYKKAKDLGEKKKIAEFYLQNRRKINNWDLVDLSAPNVVGNWLWLTKMAGASTPALKSFPIIPLNDFPILFDLARSPVLWDRRIAVLSSFEFIKNGHFDTSLCLAELLLKDPHDLIHKALGWMLREIGKRSLPAEKKFLDKYAKDMQRTMLRYAIEKFPEKERKRYLRLI